MKKVFSLIAPAILAVGFTACSQSDVLEDNGFSSSATSNDNAIQFGTYMGKVGTTRAGIADVITTSSLETGAHKTAGFGVFAYMKGTGGATDCYTTGTWNTSTPNFMYNQQVIYSGSTWTYSPVKYWPNDFSTTDVDNKTGDTEANKAQGSVAAGKVSFFAYAPYIPVTPSTGVPTSAYSPKDYGITALTNNTATTEPKVTYKFKYTTDTPSYDYTTNAEENVDLLWGMRPSAEEYNLANGSTSVALGADGYNIDLTKQTTGERINFLFKHALAKIGGVNGLKVQLDVDDNAGGALDSKSNVSVQSIVIKGVTDKIATTGIFNIAKGVWESPTLDTNYEETELFNVTHATTGIDDAIFTAAGSPFTYSSSWSEEGVTHTPKSIFKDATGNPAEFYLIPGVAGQELEVTITYQVRTYDTNLDGNYSTVNQTIKNIVTLPALETNKYYTLIMHLGLTSVKFEASVADWESTGAGIEKKVWLPSNVVE